MALDAMKYKDFWWFNNPATCTYTCEKSIAAHRYPELSAAELEDMGPGYAIISGDGEFFGNDAYSRWHELNMIFKHGGPGVFYHPVFTDVTMAVMKKLEAKLEPIENYVAYSFEFWQHVPPITVVSNATKAAKSSTTKSVKSTGTDTSIDVGDVVIANGYVYRSSDGKNRGVKLTNKQLTVTHTNYDDSWAIKPVHVGTYGWMALSDVKLVKDKTSTIKGQDIKYVVKPGDCLSKICARYGVKWRDVATYNKIKNPNIIYVGQIIKIKV